ncbi:MAG: LysR family transcriptional regulator [Coriobacteriia bacterium]|nr:LysR family transcriptional regulator [Coriobacteriia bacterium]
MNINITLRQLEVLTAIGRKGTVTAAARSLGMVQSAARTSLSELERLLRRPRKPSPLRAV